MTRRAVRALNFEEVLVERFLRGAGYEELVSKPNGIDCWPDFSIGQKKSIEVRRLNHVHEHPKHSGCFVESDETPVLQAIENTLTSFGFASSHSYFVTIDLWCHLDRSKRIRFVRALHAALATFVRDQATHAHWNLLPGCEVEVTPASRPLTRGRFVIGGYSDLNSAAWVVDDLATAMTYCIREKSLKITAQYSSHWLALVDHSGLFQDLSDAEEAWKMVQPASRFERVMLLHPTRDDLVFDSFAPGGVSRVSAAVYHE